MDKVASSQFFQGRGYGLKTTFNEMNEILERTSGALTDFMGIIAPVISDAQDEHQRLYWHHIYEEEEHRSDRLNLLMPKIQQLIEDDVNITDDHGEFVHLLQDISLEKFGLHNFLEHLDLSLFQFRGTEQEAKIQEFRDFTYEDYQQMKVILEKLNQEFKGGLQFSTSIPTDEKDEIDSHLKIETYTHSHDHRAPFIQEPLQSRKKTLTVGSLKQH
jgi:hypothetical protein